MKTANIHTLALIRRVLLASLAIAIVGSLLFIIFAGANARHTTDAF